MTDEFGVNPPFPVKRIMEERRHGAKTLHWAVSRFTDWDDFQGEMLEASIGDRVSVHSVEAMEVLSTAPVGTIVMGFDPQTAVRHTFQRLDGTFWASPGSRRFQTSQDLLNFFRKLMLVWAPCSPFVPFYTLAQEQDVWEDEVESIHVYPDGDEDYEDEEGSYDE